MTNKENEVNEYLRLTYNLIPTLTGDGKAALEKVLDAQPIEFLQELSEADIRHVSVLAKKTIRRKTASLN